jgi:hypothetical protein
MTAAPDDLTAIFGPAAATKPDPNPLTGRLPRVSSAPGRPVAAPAATPVAVPPAPPVAEPVATPQAPISNSTDTGTRQISVYVLPHVPNAIRAAKAGRTNAAVVYDAIERCHTRMSELLTARRAATPPAEGTGTPLFNRQASDARVDPQRVPWTFKATPANRAVLDQLVATHKATSRSELISTALEATYPPTASS